MHGMHGVHEGGPEGAMKVPGVHGVHVGCHGADYRMTRGANTPILMQIMSVPRGEDTIEIRSNVVAPTKHLSL